MATSGRTAAGERAWESACELFYREGLRASGVAEIAQHSGIGKPSIYRNFGSKDQLAVAYLEAQACAPVELLVGLRAAYPNDPAAQLHSVIAEIADALRSPGHRGCPLANAAVEFPDRDHPIRRAADRLKAHYLAVFTELITDLGVQHPGQLAYQIQMLVDGAHITSQMFDADRSALGLTDATERLIQSHLHRPGEER